MCATKISIKFLAFANSERNCEQFRSCDIEPGLESVSVDSIVCMESIITRPGSTSSI